MSYQDKKESHNEDSNQHAANGIFNLTERNRADKIDTDFDVLMKKHHINATPRQFVRTDADSVKVDIGNVHINIKVSAYGEVEIDIKK